MSRAADLPAQDRGAFDAPAAQVDRRLQRAGRRGRRLRTARQRELRNELAALPFALANYAMRALPRNRLASPAQVVARLGQPQHLAPLERALLRWHVPHVRSEDRRALVPFLLAGYYYARLFHGLAGPPPAPPSDAWWAASERDERELRMRWGNPAFAQRLFRQRSDRTAWLANVTLAADGLTWLRHRPVPALQLVRWCSSPGCPSPFFAFRGSGAGCGRVRCRVAKHRAATRTRPRRRVTPKPVKPVNVPAALTHEPRRAPLIPHVAGR